MANKLLRNLSGAWSDKQHYDKSECKFQEKLAQGFHFSSAAPISGLAEEVAKARQFLKQSLQCMEGIAALSGLEPIEDVNEQIAHLESQNKYLQKQVESLTKTVNEDWPRRIQVLEEQIGELEKSCTAAALANCPIQICPAKPAAKKEEPKKEEPKKEEDDDVDLFGSDSENDEEKEKIKNERLAAYEAKKSKKPVLIAKSSVILDVKPWDDETDMKALEVEVRKIESDGLLWGASKLVPVAYNIKKLQINCVVEDDKISIDWLVDKIQEAEDYVQSVDIAAFNKI